MSAEPVSKSTKVQKRKVQHSPSSTNQLLNHASQLKNTHMKEMRRRKRDFLRRINYGYTFTVAVLPALALIYLIRTSESFIPEKQETLYFTCIYYNITMLAFTAGYHKYFAHNSFKVRFKFIQYFFAIFGASSGLGSIRWWASLHRAHHHFTDDTERDPYSIKRGFTWAHWGWLIKKPKITTFYHEFMEQEFPKNTEASKIINEATIDEDGIEYSQGDLKRNDYDEYLQQLLIWQESRYLILFFITTFLIPVLITVIVCHDTIAHGVIYPGLLRMFLCQQSLLSTESVCHLKSIQVSIPTQPFNDKNTSQNCNNPLVSLLTYGQAHQNYHHEFPHDYRSTSSIFAYDPTKWFIWTMEKVGLVEELCKTPENLIVQLRIQQQQQVINRMKSQLNWGTPISKLPLITPKDFKRIIASSSNKDRIYIVIQNIIHDITPFMDQHPGGVPLLKASHGKDATKAFYGGVYGHSTAAVNLLATMRIGMLDVGNEEEVWKRVVREEGDVEESGARRSNKSYRTAEAA
ncbi:stearoyl-CoA desaturase [Scheffersomyces xylosifermentans]|uniref:stearoyl-CoA desaturase n=1 Tax=Scheffersomyces xylosifermentans TaxID=1304137 RepID=UPI00315CA441